MIMKENKYKSIFIIIIMMFLTACDKLGDVGGPCTDEIQITTDGGTFSGGADGLGWMGWIQVTVDGATGGILTTLSTQISTALATASQDLFQAIISTAIFQEAFGAAATLAVVLFAVLCLVGAITMTVGEAVIFLLRIAILTFLVANMGNFQTLVADFFIQGQTDILTALSAEFSPAGISFNPNNAFDVIDDLISLVLSPHMMITILAMIFTGWQGWLMAILLLAGILLFVMMVASMFWVWALSQLVMQLLLGLFPIFAICYFFKVTRPVCDNAINQCAAAFFMPCALFIFYYFTAGMMMNALTPIFAVKSCWCTLHSLRLLGDIAFWRVVPVSVTGNECSVDLSWGAMGPVSFSIDDMLVNAVEFTAACVTFGILGYIGFNLKRIITDYIRELFNTTFNIGNIANPIEERINQGARDAGIAVTDIAGDRARTLAAKPRTS